VRDRPAGRPNTPDCYLETDGNGSATADSHAGRHGDTLTTAHSKHARAPADSHAQRYNADKYAHTGGNSHTAAAIHDHTNTGGDACHDPGLRLQPEFDHHCVG
jgi:hypothetical protein